MSNIIQTGDVDVSTVEILDDDADNVEMEARAKEVAQILATTYPDHPWAVGWAPGAVLVIKHLAGQGKYGYTIDHAGLCSHKALVRAARQAGGELLERMGMERGRWNGEYGTEYQQ